MIVGARFRPASREKPSPYAAVAAERAARRASLFTPPDGHHQQKEDDMADADPTSTLEADELDDDTHNDDPLILLAEGTLRGDVRDSLLAWVKTLPKPWGMLSEREQRDLADAADRYARELVKTTAGIIASGERPTTIAKLVEYKEKDGLEAKLKIIATAENVAELHKACGREVLLVTSGAEDFMDEGGPAEIDADQPGFPNLGEEYDEDNR